MAVGAVLALVKPSAAMLPREGRPERPPIESSSIVDAELWMNRHTLAEGIEYNLRYLRSPQAERRYHNFNHAGLSKDLVERSLARFKSLLEECRSPDELRAHLVQEFKLYRSRGSDGAGTVLFTGYFQPTYKASRVKTAEYRFALYRRPANFTFWPKPHLSRVELEGEDGLGGRLRGSEIAWLRSRYQAYMIHVQGSAVLEMTDGSRVSIGFADATDHPFVGLSPDCYSGKPAGQNLEEFFNSHPSAFNRCLSRNNRFVFFAERGSPRPIGSLGAPVIPGRSIATDKIQLPPGALGLIRAKLPAAQTNGQLDLQRANRIVLDQDEGRAIRGPGRVDIFMGTGTEAQRRATMTCSSGELYYLVLK